jgi:glycine betaine/proline transport system substrate-binding protein
MLGAALATALLAGAGSAASAAEMGAKDEAIKLAVLEWVGNNVSVHMAGQLLEKMGYKVEYVTAGSFPQFTGLADGSLSATIEVWMNNVGDIYPKVKEAGQIEDLGNLKLETKEGWAYPKHMEQICPGLPDWSALMKPECVQALSTPDTAPNGRFLDYPADWGSRAATILKDNEMPYQAIAAGSEGAMVAELDAATAAKTPLIMMFWGPHYSLARNDVGWVTMPPCKSQDNAHCINPPDANKIVWSGFKGKWPAAYEFLKLFEVSAEEQQKMMLRIDAGENIDAVVKDWVDTHEDRWGPWVKAAQG